MDDWRCPICGHAECREVFEPVISTDGEQRFHRKTGVYECAGCSVLFRNPLQFNAESVHGIGSMDCGVPCIPGEDFPGAPD